jgi:hypothetical protein
MAGLKSSAARDPHQSWTIMLLVVLVALLVVVGALFVYEISRVNR